MAKITIGAINYVAGSSRNYKTGSWRSMRPIFHEDKCKFCKQCYDFCPDSAITLDETKKKAVVDYNYCKGCGICAKECKFQAITMEEEVK